MTNYELEISVKAGNIGRVLQMLESQEIRVIRVKKVGMMDGMFGK